MRGREADFGFYVAGGKGAVSRKTPAEITAACEALAREPDALVGASRLAAKVDNTALQDGYQLYHHCFVFTPSGKLVRRPAGHVGHARGPRGATTG